MLLITIVQLIVFVAQKREDTRMTGHNDCRSVYPRRFLRTILLAAGVCGSMMVFAKAFVGNSNVLNTTLIVGQAEVDAAKIVGHQQCAECHISEVAAWKASPHGSQSFQLLSHENAPEFAKAMGITGSLSSSMCADCHATKTASTTVLQGVSCERCHGAAGPASDGWFSIHSDLGNAEKDRLKETKEHYDTRIAACQSLGMNRSADVGAIAKNCLSCHTVPNEKLVNAGHPTTKRFELVEWSQGSVRHNFQLDQAVNAESPSLWLDSHWNEGGRTVENRKKLMFVIGQLADLEVSLRSRANASDGDFGTAVGRRISSARRELSKMDCSEVKQALDAIAAIDRSALRTYQDGDAALYSEAADKVAEAAKALAKNHDGSKLGDVDVPSDAVGDPFESP